jgi:hypothetical protein
MSFDARWLAEDLMERGPSCVRVCSSTRIETAFIPTA